MISNCIITVYHKPDTGTVYECYHVPAWREEVTVKLRSKTGAAEKDGIKLTFQPNGTAITGGDYVVLAKISDVLEVGGVSRFLAANKAYTVQNVKFCCLPGGSLHHLEVSCV